MSDGERPGPSRLIGIRGDGMYTADCETCGWTIASSSRYDADDQAEQHPCEVLWLRARLRDLRAKVHAVRELHKPREVCVMAGQVTDTRTGETTYPRRYRTTCDYCSRTHVGGYEGVSWPCPTVAALGDVAGRGEGAGA